MTKTKHSAVLGLMESAGWAQAWRAKAACDGADLALFFPVGDGWRGAAATAEAKKFCEACPVRLPCRDWSLQSGEDYGVFGGLTAAERRLLSHPPRQHLRSSTTSEDAPIGDGAVQRVNDPVLVPRW